MANIKTKIIPREPLKLKEKIYLVSIFNGLKITFTHFFRNLSNSANIKAIEYPEQSPDDITNRYRGEHRLLKNKDGSTRCVACFMCATYCPSNCIFIKAGERVKAENQNIENFSNGAKDTSTTEKVATSFTIDLLECVFCGLCVEACPHDAIRMDSGIFAVVGAKREDFKKDINALLATKGMSDDDF